MKNSLHATGAVKQMSEKRSNFFQDHSLKYMEMAFRTDRQEKMAMPDGYGKRTGDCGDKVEFFLAVRDDVIEGISFLVNGCMNTNACCNRSRRAPFARAAGGVSRMAGLSVPTATPG